MPSITIRDVPSETRDELAARAAAAGQSLQEYLLSELKTLVATPDINMWLERVQKRKDAMPVDNEISDTEIVEMIRHARDMRG